MTFDRPVMPEPYMMKVLQPAQRAGARALLVLRREEQVYHLCISCALLNVSCCFFVKIFISLLK